MDFSVPPVRFSSSVPPLGAGTQKLQQHDRKYYLLFSCFDGILKKEGVRLTVSPPPPVYPIASWINWIMVTRAARNSITLITVGNKFLPFSLFFKPRGLLLETFWFFRRTRNPLINTS
jgi:hypothetical protein